MVKPPFSKRQNPERLEEFHALQEGVPEGLLPSLRDWTESEYASLTGARGSLHRRRVVSAEKLRLLERRTDRQIMPDNSRRDPAEFRDQLTADRMLLLDAADMALSWADRYAADELESFLVDARSIYCVGTDTDGNYELQQRQSQEMIALVDSEANQPGRSAQHLRSAWSRCYGRNPDPKGACREAVEAIEVAAKSVVTPDDPVATLGKMCSAMRAKPSKWETDSEFDGSVESVLSMMDMVWKGHLRHGDEDAPLEVSQEAAEMIVQTAVLLVSWFRSGRIRLKS